MALLASDSFDAYRNHTADNLMNEQWISAASMQQLRITGRYDDDGTDYAIALMNTGFGRATYYMPLTGASGSVFFTFDACTTRGTGGAFAGDSDFVSIAGYDPGSATWKEQVKVAVRSDGKLQVWRSTGTNFTGTLLAETDPDTLEQDIWKRVTVKFGLTTGIWVYVDEVEVVALPAQALVVPASGVMSMGRVGFCWESFGFEAIGLDNMVLYDSISASSSLYALKGALHVKANYVDSAEEPATVGTWTPNTGTTLATLVDERPNDLNYPDRDITYMSASADAEAVFKFRRFFPTGDIMGVVVRLGAKASAGMDITSIVRGVADYYHPTAVALTSSASYFFSQFPYNVDPEDLAQWDQDDFIAQRWRFGLQVNFPPSPAGTLRITQLVVDVIHDRSNASTADYRIF